MGQRDRPPLPAPRPLPRCHLPAALRLRRPPRPGPAQELHPAAVPAPVPRRARLHPGRRPALRRRGQRDRATQDGQALLLAGLLDQRHPRPRHDRTQSRTNRVRAGDLRPRQRPPPPHPGTRSRRRRPLAGARATRRRRLGDPPLMPAPALQAAGAALRGRSLLPRALIAAAVALLGLLLLVAAPIALLSSGGGPGPSSVPDGIPGAFVPVYRESARAFHLDWLLLASVHQQETGFSTNPTTYHGLNAAGCCAGPFQFNLVNGPPSTWVTHRLAYRQGSRPGDYPHPQ